MQKQCLKRGGRNKQVATTNARNKLEKGGKDKQVATTNAKTVLEKGGEKQAGSDN